MQNMKLAGLIIITLIVLSGCANKEEAANKLFVEMTQNAQKASIEHTSHAKKYEYYKMAKTSYEKIVENYPETSIALKLSTGDEQILDKNPLMFLQMDRQLYELSEIERNPFNLLSERILKGGVNTENVKSLERMMVAYAEAGRADETQHLYKAISAFYDTYKDQTDRDKFKIKVALEYAEHIKNSDALSELDKAYEIATKKYGPPKSTTTNKLYPDFAKAYVMQQKSEISERILSDYSGSDYRKENGDIDVYKIMIVAEVYALFKKDYSIQLAELGVSEQLKKKPNLITSVYFNSLLKTAFKEGQEEKFLQMFKEALVWSTSDNPKTAGNPIYAIESFAKLLKELNFKDTSLISLASLDGTYDNENFYDMNRLATCYWALGYDKYALDTYNKSISLATGNNSNLFAVSRALSQQNYLDNSLEVISLIDDITLKDHALYLLSAKHAENQNYILAMETANKSTNALIDWVNIEAEHMKSGKVRDYEFVKASYRVYSNLKKIQ